MANVTPTQVYQDVLSQGGSSLQAQVAAALVSGIESNGDPTVLSGGVGPAQGLFQFEPGTSTGGAGGGKNGLPSTVGAATWQQQVTGFINDTGGPGGSNFQAWGPDITANGGDPNSASNPNYSYTGAPQAGSKVGNIIAQNATSWGAAAPADLTSNVTGSSAGSASPAGTGAASTSPAAQSQSVTLPGSTDAGFNANPTVISATSQQATALQTIQSNFSAYGLSPADSAAITQWAWGELTNNTDPTQIALDFQTPGTQGYQIFQKYYPGFVQANENLSSQGLPTVNVAQYAGYQTQAMAAAQAAGFPPGFLNKDNVGVLIGGNVSTTELAARMNDAVALAYNSTPDQQAQFNSYFGVQDNNPYLGVDFSGHGPITAGQIAALALDPKTAEPLIHQQITAAQIGGSGVTAGVGAISVGEATKLAQAGVSGQASFAGIAPLAPLENALPGQVTNGATGANAVNADTLVGSQLLPDATSVRALQVAEEARKAPFTGGGGIVQNAKGVVGAGSAANQGSPSSGQ